MGECGEGDSTMMDPRGMMTASERLEVEAWRRIHARSMATGVESARMLSAQYLPSWLEDEEWVQAFEVGYRAFTWAQDCNPYEYNDLEDIRAMVLT